MSALNYKHLHYFWAVAKAGGVTRASERLHLTPQTISGQLTLFEEVLGEKLFKRSGRNFALTEMGQMVFSYADEIFALGNELEEALHHRPSARPMQFSVGITDSVPKALAYQLLEPAIQIEQAPRIICREGKAAELLAQLSVHKLDIVIADCAMPRNIDVKGYSHLLGECGLTFFATKALAKYHTGPFPHCLNNAPMLMPSEDVAVRPRLLRWMGEHNIRPRIAGEFDDSALMKAFGQAGAGIFAAPSAIAEQITRQYEVIPIGTSDEVIEQYYAISVERKLSHPAVLAISRAARRELLVKRNS